MITFIIIFVVIVLFICCMAFLVLKTGMNDSHALNFKLSKSKEIKYSKYRDDLPNVYRDSEYENDTL